MPAAWSASEAQNAPQRSSRCGSSRSCISNRAREPGSKVACSAGSVGMEPIYGEVKDAHASRLLQPEANRNNARGRMTWDFSTDPDYQEQLDWMAEFVRREIW